MKIGTQKKVRTVSAEEGKKTTDDASPLKQEVSAGGVMRLMTELETLMNRPCTILKSSAESTMSACSRKPWSNTEESVSVDTASSSLLAAAIIYENVICSSFLQICNVVILFVVVLDTGWFLC